MAIDKNHASLCELVPLLRFRGQTLVKPSRHDHHFRKINPLLLNVRAKVLLGGLIRAASGKMDRGILANGLRQALEGVKGEEAFLGKKSRIIFVLENTSVTLKGLPLVKKALIHLSKSVS